MITNFYIEPNQTLKTPNLKSFVGDTQNIVIESHYLEYVNIGNEVSSRIIEYDIDTVHLYDITLPFEFNNFTLNFQRLNDGYLKYFTQIIY